MKKSKVLKLALLFVGVTSAAALTAQPQTTSWNEELVGGNCTSIMVGRKATTDGSVITSHTCDGKYRTWVKMEPAADHEPGSMCNISLPQRKATGNGRKHLWRPRHSPQQIRHVYDRRTATHCIATLR